VKMVVTGSSLNYVFFKQYQKRYGDLEGCLFLSSCR